MPGVCCLFAVVVGLNTLVKVEIVLSLIYGSEIIEAFANPIIENQAANKRRFGG